MSINKLRLPDEEALEAFDQLMIRQKTSEFPGRALALRYLERLSIDPNFVYRRFEIPKGRGKKRVIEAPEEDLNRFQGEILRVLHFETPPDHVHAFTPGRSAYQGLRKMLNQVESKGDGNADLESVYSTDIKDFFPSVQSEDVKEHVYRMLFRILHKWEKGPQLSQEVVNQLANIITDICCLHGRLPQGAPTSPVLSNMVGTGFDHQIIKKLPDSQTYGRYADDIVILGIEKLDKKTRGLIKSIIESFGFKTSIPKTSNETGKPFYKIWGVQVFPKRTRGKESLTFRLPRKQVLKWSRDIFEFINSDDLPTTSEDLLENKRYKQTMGRLSLAHVVTKYGEIDFKNPILLPKELTHAWSHLCRKFQDILPRFHRNYFMKTGLHYVQEIVSVPLDLEGFKNRLKKFIERNDIDKAEFERLLKKKRKEIFQLMSIYEDEDIDTILSEELYEIVDNFEDLSVSEKENGRLDVIATLCAFTQLKLEGLDERISKLESYHKENTILTEKLDDMWLSFRSHLGDDLKWVGNHPYNVQRSFLFWGYQRKTNYVLKPKVMKKSKGPQVKNYAYLPGFE